MTIDVSPIPNFIPSGFKSINLMLVVRDAMKAVEFYNRAFNAEEVMRLTDVNGKVVHSEIKINDTIIMLAEDDTQTHTPGGVIIALYVGDVEGFTEEAVKAGCEVIYPIKQQFYGDRAGRIKDPFGYQWIIATHTEDVSASEMQKRFNDLFLH